MTKRIFTFLVAFLATVGNAVWGQSATTIDISNIVSNTSFSSGSETLGYIAKHGDYDSAGNTLEISKSGSYKIKGNASQSGTNSNVQISIAEGITVTIELDNLRTDASLGNVLHTNTDEAEKLVKADRCALEIGKGATVTLIWNNVCKLTSGGDRAGINVKEGATLIMKGSNNYELEVGSWNNASNGAITYGAGIGGDKTGASFGTIIIESGDIRAYSYAQGSGGKAYGAGIGGGYSDDTPNTSTSGSIIIKGGNIEATSAAIQNATSGEDYGAGIGGGYAGTVSDITIIGGTVSGTSDKGDDIGDGQSYSGNNSAQIIIGKEEPNTDLNVTAETINDDNFLDIRNENSPTITGIVTLPEGTQIYSPKEPTGTGTLHAYKIDLSTSMIQEDGEEGQGHTVNNFPETIAHTYYAHSTATKTVEIPVGVSCSLNHLFMGWLNTTESGQKIDETAQTITIPTSASTEGIKKLYVGAAVWVDNKHDIVVANMHEWEKDDKTTNPPTIAVVPEDAISLLSFTLDKGDEAGGRLEYVDIEDNVFTGMPYLELDESSINLDDVTVKVKVKGSSSPEKEIETPILIHSGSILVTGITVNQNHTYTGQAHNNTDDDPDHLFTLTATVEGSPLPDGYTLTEGVHYIIKSADSNPSQTLTESAQGSKQIINAATYSNIQLKGKGGLQFKIGNANESTTYTLSESVTVNKRELSIQTSQNTITVNGTDPDFNTNWKSYVSVKNIVTGEEDEVTASVTAAISPTTTDWYSTPGNYIVTFTPEETLSGDKAGNYSMNTTPVTRNIIVKGDADDVTITPGDDSPWNMAGDGTFSHVYDGNRPNIGTLAITVAGVNEPVILTEDKNFTVDYDGVEKDVKEEGYTATITFKENDYITTDATKEVTLYITARPLNITFKDKVSSIDGLTVADLVIAEGLVNGEKPTYEGTIKSEAVEGKANTYHITIEGFKIKDNNTFTSANYAITVKGNAYTSSTEGEEIDLGEITVDPDYDGGDGNIDRIDYYNIYEDEICEGVTVEFSRDVVREGQSVLVTVKVEEGFDTTKLALKFKRALFGYWEDLTLTPTENPGEYIIKNIYTDIYVRAEGAVPTGIESVDGVKVYTKDGSLFVQTPQQEQVRIISITGAIVKNEQQVGLKQYTGLQRGVYVVMVGDQVFKVRI